MVRKKLIDSKAITTRKLNDIKVQLPVFWLRDVFNWYQYIMEIKPDGKTMYQLFIKMLPVIVEWENNGKIVYRSGILILNDVEEWKGREEEVAAPHLLAQLARVRLYNVKIPL